MSALASPAELAEFLSFTFDDADAARAAQILDLVSEEARGRDGCGQQLDAATTTETLDGPGTCVLLLAQIPVSAVASVVEDGTALTEGTHYEWSTAGVLRRVGQRWPSKLRSVVVTYTHGYANVPRDIKLVVLQAAGRRFVNPEGHMQRRRGDASTSFASSTDEATGFTPSERRVLARYRP